MRGWGTGASGAERGRSVELREGEGWVYGGRLFARGVGENPHSRDYSLAHPKKGGGGLWREEGRGGGGRGRGNVERDRRPTPPAPPRLLAQYSLERVGRGNYF